MKRAIAALLLAATAGLAAAPAEATLITYVATLSGAAEAPPNGSPGTGSTVVTIDTALQTMQVAITFSGLTGTTTASHIHCCTALPGTGTAGVATITPNFTGFPLGVTAGFYSFTYSLNTAPGTYNPAFVTAQGGLAQAEVAFLAGLASGSTYLNIHTSAVPGGEIRGFLQATPEPASMLLFTAGLLGLGFVRRQTRG